MVTNGDPSRRHWSAEVRRQWVGSHEVNQAHPLAFRPWNALALSELTRCPATWWGCICVEGAANRRWLAAFFVSP